MARLMMKLKQLIGTERQGSISPAIVIAEFHFVNAGSESFDHGAHLTSPKVPVSDVL